MIATGKSPETARRGGSTGQRRLTRPFRGFMAALVVLLLALTLPWTGLRSDVHAVRMELAEARATLRAATDASAVVPPDAFGGGSPAGLASAGRATSGRHQDAMAVQARARHAERRIRQAEAELGALLAEARDRNLLAGLVVQVRSLVHPSRDPATAGRLQVPVQGVVTSGFGPRTVPSWGDGGMHDGIDLFAPSGTSVKAAASGKVIFTGRRPESGMSVIVDHGPDLEGRVLHTVYSHLSSIDVRRGQQVDTGDVLGQVGNTGTHTTGPHLHFEVRLEGEPVDPRAWL